MKNIIYPEIERAEKSEIKKFQEEKLKEQLDYILNNSTYYKKLFKKNNVDYKNIKTLEDLQKVPTTHKNDLQKYNDEFICVSQREIIDYPTTSGTMGDPVTFALTDSDIDRLAYNEAISFMCANVNQDSIIQLTTTIDKRFMAGMAYWQGARKLGASIIRVGAGVLGLQWDSIQRFSPDTLIVVPSFLHKLIEYAEENGIDYKNSSVKQAICIGDALRNIDFSLSKLAESVAEKWPIKLYSTYASTELSTAFTECEYNRGGHHHPELIIVEFLDDNDKVVKEGELGEVTITPLGVRGTPLIRFKTGDICHHYTEKCQCGLTSLRVGPIVGRKNQMIKFKGTTLFPPAVYEVLDGMEIIDDYIVEVNTSELGLDALKVIISLKEKNTDFEKTIKDNFKSKLRVTPEIILMGINELKLIKYPQENRKAITFIDNRKKNND